MSRLYRIKKQLDQLSAAMLNKLLTSGAKQHLVSEITSGQPHIILEAVAPHLNHAQGMDDLEFVFEPENAHLAFEDLVGLFTSNAFNSNIASLTLKEGALLYSLPGRLTAKKVVEIGRYKSGSTLFLAAGMMGNGTLWSVDIGRKEARLMNSRRPFDDQAKDRFTALSLNNVQFVIGNSAEIQLETDGYIDLIFVDGDHSYEGVRADFENFHPTLRVGGQMLFHDANPEPFSQIGHTDTVGRLVDEILASGDYRRVQDVDRITCLERVR